VIPYGMLQGCTATFSVEIPLAVTKIRDYAFYKCHCLRNVTFPPNAVTDNNILNEATDLLLLFSSIAKIIHNLKHRFDELPVHSTVYYQLYNQGDNQKDCLGMTPLHILACSSVHNLEVYRTIIDNYPANLITEDRWGALPLLYAFWGGAPTEIIQFLLNRYQSLYPDHIVNWTMMVETMGRCDTPKKRIEIFFV
jgi:hypothetical protein